MPSKTPITDAIDALVQASRPGLISALERARRLEESHANLVTVLERMIVAASWSATIDQRFAPKSPALLDASTVLAAAKELK
jgi:hypothetical protein